MASGSWTRTSRSASSRSSERVLRGNGSNGSSLRRRLRLRPLDPPRAGDRAVDEERGERVRRLRREDPRPEALGQHLRPPRVHEQRRVPRGQEADGRRRVLLWQGCAWEVDQLGTVGVREPAEAQPLDAGSQRRDVDPGPVGGLRDRGRAEGAQVPAQQQVVRVRLADLCRTDPALRGREHVRTPALPRAGGGHADELDADAVPRERRPGGREGPHDLEQLVAPARPVRQRPPHGAVHRLDVHIAHVPPVGALPPRALVACDRDREGPEVPFRDDVDRRAHERRLHRLPPLERSGEVAEREAVEPRPEADVRRRCVLRLEPRDALEGAVSGSRERSSRNWRASRARFSRRSLSSIARRGGPLPARPEATLSRPRGYSSVGRAPGSHPGGRRFESA